MATFADISIRFGADLKQFSSQMQNVQRTLKRVGGSLTKTGKNLTTNVTAPIVALGGLAVKTFADFEQQLATVRAVSGATASQFQALRDSALELGATTRFTSSEVAQLQINLSRIGFNPEQINTATASILDLALASGEDLAQSAQVAAATVRGFQLDISETQRVVDVMASSFSATALQLSSFQVAMATVAPVAQSANATLEQTTGLLGVLVNAGVDASTAGTGLRNVFLKLAERGISLDDALNKITTATDRNAAALKLFGTRGATVGTILAANIEEANEFAGAFTNAAGSAKRMAGIMDDTTQGALFRLRSAVEGLAISFGEDLAPFVVAASERISEIANNFRELTPDVRQNIIQFAAFAAAIGPVILVLGTLIKSIGTVTVAVRSLTLAIAANPLGALAIAITAVVVSLIAYDVIQSKINNSRRQSNTLQEKALENTSKERAELSSLVAIAKSDAVSKEQRLKAVKDINRISPKYLGNISLETINTEKAKTALENYNKELLRSARIKAAQTRLQEIQSNIIDLELAEAIRLDKANSAQTEFIKNLRKQGLSYKDIQDQLKQINLAGDLGTEVANNRLKVLKEEQKVLLDIIGKSGGLTLKTNTNIPPIGTTLPGEKEGRENGKSFANAFIDEAASAFGAREFNSEDIGNLFGDFNIDNDTETFLDRLRTFNEDVNTILNDGLVNIISDAFAAIGESIVNGTNVFSAVGASLLSSIGSIASRLGRLAIGVAIGIEGIKISLRSLNPAAAFAAGAALLVLGSAVSAAARNIGSSSGGGSGASFAGTDGSDTTAGGVITSTSNASAEGFFGRVVFEIGYDKLIGVLEQGLETRLRTQG